MLCTAVRQYYCCSLSNLAEGQIASLVSEEEATSAGCCSLRESWERQRWPETPRWWFTALEVHKQQPSGGAVVVGRLRSPVLPLLPTAVVLELRLQRHPFLSTADAVVDSLPPRIIALCRDPLTACTTAGDESLTLLKHVEESIAWTSLYFYTSTYSSTERHERSKPNSTAHMSCSK